jgi:mannose-6-phosphate isomerase-like protein (cupin superfamily)
VKRIDIQTPIEALTLYRLGKGGRATWEFVELNHGQFYPPHLHENSDATLRVVAGTGTLFLDDKAFPFQPGQTVHVPRGAWHGFQVDGMDAVLLSRQMPPIFDAATGRIDIRYKDEPGAENP